MWQTKWRKWDDTWDPTISQGIHVYPFSTPGYFWTHLGQVVLFWDNWGTGMFCVCVYEGGGVLVMFEVMSKNTKYNNVT